MKRLVYEAILEAIHCASDPKRCLRDLCQIHPMVTHDALVSIYAQDCQRQTKQGYQQHRRADVMQQYYERYVDSASEDLGQGSFVLLEMAAELSLSPTLLARLVLERYFIHRFGEQAGKSVLSKWIAHPQVIPDQRLAKEVWQDKNYGPLVDNIKHSVGLEYEYVLREKLHNLGIPFAGEEILQAKQYPSTPDIKLLLPITVSGYVVNWIESKAMFGDEQSVSGHLQEQCWNYHSLYGPGLVIYWFGFIDELNCHQSKGILIRDSFPLASEVKLVET